MSHFQHYYDICARTVNLIHEFSMQNGNECLQNSIWLVIKMSYHADSLWNKLSCWNNLIEFLTPTLWWSLFMGWLVGFDSETMRVFFCTDSQLNKQSLQKRLFWQNSYLCNAEIAYLAKIMTTPMQEQSFSCRL